MYAAIKLELSRPKLAKTVEKSMIFARDKCFCHFWAREAFNRSENSIIVFSAIFPFREVSAWPTFLKLIFSLRKRSQFFLASYHGYKAQIVSIWSVRVSQNFQNDVAWNPYVRFGWFFHTSYKIDSSCYSQSLKT